VLEDARGHLVGIEVKKSASPDAHDFKGLRFLAEKTEKKFLRGILLYTGNESVSFGTHLLAVSINTLWASVGQYSIPLSGLPFQNSGISHSNRFSGMPMSSPKIGR
jgi:hypothetical protein